MVSLFWVFFPIITPYAIYSSCFFFKCSLIVCVQKHHFRELTAELQASLGRIPDEFVSYFTSRFPLLLWQTYNAMKPWSITEAVLQQYYWTTVWLGTRFVKLCANALVSVLCLFKIFFTVFTLKAMVLVILSFVSYRWVFSFYTCTLTHFLFVIWYLFSQ